MRLGAVRIGSAPPEEQQSELRFEAPPPRSALPVLDTRERGTSFRQLEVRSGLNSAASTHMGFWSINPYVGCEFGCSYCYARDTHRYAVERQATAGHLGEASDEALLAMSPVDAFERHILVKRNLADVLLRTLEPSRIGDAAIVIGTATDPYQPAERSFGITRSVLEVLQRFRGLHLGIITKSPLITRDLGVLRELAANHRLRVHISIATADGPLLRRLEPRTPMPHARLRALERLAKAGVDAGIMAAPIIPLITDSREQLAQLFAAAKDAGARFVHAGPLRLGPTARRRFLAQVAREFPDILARYERHFARSENAEPAYRDALARRLEQFRQEFGFPRGNVKRPVITTGVDDVLEEQLALLPG